MDMSQEDRRICFKYFGLRKNLSAAHRGALIRGGGGKRASSFLNYKSAPGTHYAGYGMYFPFAFGVYFPYIILSNAAENSKPISFGEVRQY